MKMASRKQVLIEEPSCELLYSVEKNNLDGARETTGEKPSDWFSSNSSRRKSKFGEQLILAPDYPDDDDDSVDKDDIPEVYGNNSSQNPEAEVPHKSFWSLLQQLGKFNEAITKESTDSTFDFDDSISEACSNASDMSAELQHSTEQMEAKRRITKLLHSFKLPDINDLSDDNDEDSDESRHAFKKGETSSEVELENIESIEYECEAEHSYTSTDVNSEILHTITEDDDLLELLESTEEETMEIEADSFDDYEGQSKHVRIIEPSGSVEDDLMAQTQKEAMAFLQRLIDDVVKQTEHPAKLFLTLLQKEALCNELFEKATAKEEENLLLMQLHRRAIEYFRRRRLFCNITEPQEIDRKTNDEEKFMETLSRLGFLKRRDIEIQEAARMRIKKLNENVAEAGRTATEKEAELEAFVRRTFGKNKSAEFEALLDKTFAEFAKYRDEISRTRFILILRQDTYANLIRKMEERENLGNGYYRSDYISLQNEVRNLYSKNDERANELQRNILRHVTKVHFITHMRMSMMRSVLKIERAAIHDLQLQRHTWRERFNALKIVQHQQRKELAELSFRGGLIDKPALMADYDHTVERIKEAHQHIKELKERQAELDHSISKVESGKGTIAEASKRRTDYTIHQQRTAKSIKLQGRK